jgi:hypothetical protein
VWTTEVNKVKKGSKQSPSVLFTKDKIIISVSKYEMLNEGQATVDDHSYIVYVILDT